MQSKKLLQPLLQKQEVSGVYQTIGFLPQVWLLTFKNLLITFKNPKNIIFLIITPFLLGTFLYFFQQLALDNGSILIPDPSSSPVPPYPKCGWSNCLSLDIRVAALTPNPTIGNYPWAQKVIQDMQGAYDVNVGATAITSFGDLQNYYSELETNPNRTQAGLILCLDNSFTAGDAITNFCNTGKDHTYYLVLKKLNSMGVIFHAINEPFPLDLTASALKTMVDNSILNFQLKNQGKSPSLISFQTSRFPLGPNRYIQNYDIVTAVGAFYFMITPLFVFLFVQNEIVREKEYKLRQGLNIFGATHTAYWVSWFIIAVIYSLISSVASFLAGYAFGFGFFTETPAVILIIMMFFPFNLALSMMAFFVSTVAPNSKASNTASYAIVLLAIVVQSFVSDNNLLTFIFTTNPSTLVSFLRAFLVIYPPFSYTKIFTNITIFSGYHFDITQRQWVKGFQPYNTDVFTRTTAGPLPFGGGTFERYSDLQSMGILFADALLFAILAWFFDNVIASNRGRSEPLLFPIYRLLKLFGLNKNTKPKNSSIINLRGKAFGEGAEQSAVRQRNRVYQNSDKNIPALGLRIKCLSKTFKKMCSKQEMHAINELTVEIEPNELMAILGHNGAGKTTLINILTGILDPDVLDDTQIIINRQNINNIDQIRKHIGLCAQFDILWNQLTAQQHLDLFASLKGIPKHQRKEKIQDLLEMVSLGREGKNQVKGFSGGMRRRLSLAIASVGDPRIILLDEPTTGLDPKVRQQVWRLIEKMKKTRSIILTTHSMEQADVLSDRVCVMVKGRIKCIGTTVFLKQEYGQGHRLTLNIDRKEVKSVQDTIKKLCPSAVMVDYKGGNLVVGINQFENLLKIIKVLESEQSQGLEEYELKKSIRDWNVSDATLEEVFMAVSKEKERD